MALAALAGALIGVFLSPREASKDFYSAVAGLIPVLLLTLAVQARFFALSTIREVRGRASQLSASVRAASQMYTSTPPDDMVTVVLGVSRAWSSTRRLFERTLFGLWLLGVLMVAEFAALHPLATGRAQDGNPQIIYVAITTGFLTIAGLALLGAVELGAPATATQESAMEAQEDG